MFLIILDCLQSWLRQLSKKDLGLQLSKTKFKGQ